MQSWAVGTDHDRRFALSLLLGFMLVFTLEATLH